MSNEDSISTSEMFQLVLQHMQAIDNRLASLERDNRDIKQGIANLGTRMESLESRVVGIEQAIEESKDYESPAFSRLVGLAGEIQAEVGQITYQMRSLNDNVLGIAGRQRRLEERVDNMERQPS